MGWLAKVGAVLGGGKRDEALPLYNAVVARARQPHWYVEGAVPDTVDGRFDTIAAVLSMVLIRLEREPAGAEPAARLTERFVDDMDAQLRQIGIGDITVGKHIGKMMAALGGRLGAYRDTVGGPQFEESLVRNLYRGEAPAPAALAHVTFELRALLDGLGDVPIERMLAGELA